MKSGIGNLMKQAQTMQANLKRAQAELAVIEVEGNAANGLVRIIMNCKHTVKSVHIDEQLLNDKETLEDLILLAMKDVLAKVEATSSARMAGLIPAGIPSPF
ncbi:MAG: YbaB/EbfC family nucleoid-associated protein [Methylophilaceae bacterium]|nr:YbaB/EbfC family nucleoid-associated protein [Methylophilaceae bacterium]